MCALCGVLGGDDHWTAPVARDGVYVRGDSAADRRRERRLRIAAANRILKLYGISLEDWQGASYVLRTVTGKTEIVDSLARLFPAAEKLAGRPLDPLDDAVIARREALNG